MKFLFWNVNKKNLYSSLDQLCKEHSIDVILLCEYDKNISRNGLLSEYIEINMITKRGFGFFIKNDCRASYDLITPDPHFFPISFCLNNNYQFIVYLVHFSSDLHSSGQDKRKTSLNHLKHKIVKDEDDFNTSNQIIVGDFNCNPFDLDMINNSGLNSTYNLNYLQNFRTVAGYSHKVFYNPMWEYFSYRDFPGTFYYDQTYSGENFYTYIYDQALFSKGSIMKLQGKKVEIVHTINNQPLLINGKPDKVNYSDHLPLVFNIMED